MLKEYIEMIKGKVNGCKRSNNVAIVTSNIGGYDDLHLLEHYIDNADCFAFLDESSLRNVNIRNEFWNVIEVDFIYRDPRRTAKIFKLLSHIILDKYEWIVWVDSNMRLSNDLIAKIEPMLCYADAFFFKHNKRICLYDEIDECLKWGKDSRANLIKVKEKYLSEGFPEKQGLYNCGFFVRKNSELVNRAFDFWWEQVDAYTVRDQISFPYVLKSLPFNIKSFDSKIDRCSFLSVSNHRKYAFYEKDFFSCMKIFFTKFYFLIKK